MPLPSVLLLRFVYPRTCDTPLTVATLLTMASIVLLACLEIVACRNMRASGSVIGLRPKAADPALLTDSRPETGVARLLSTPTPAVCAPSVRQVTATRVRPGPRANWWSIYHRAPSADRSTRLP